MLSEYERLYAEASEIHGDSVVLLLQVGSFWELYWTNDSKGGESANAARNILGLSLMQKDSDFSSAGFPMPAEDKISRLLDDGWTVCLGVQVPTDDKKLKVKRVLGRCTSPGLRTDASGNYACSIFCGSGSYFGAALMDVSTGCSVVVQTVGVEGIAAVTRSRNVSAVLLNGREGSVGDFSELWESKTSIIDKRPSQKLTDAMSESLIGDAYGRGGAPLDESLLLSNRPLAKHALAHLLSWARGLSSSFGENLPKPQILDPEHVVTFSKGGLGQLGIHDLDKILNCAVTPPGRRKFRHMLYNPHADAVDAARAHAAIKQALDAGHGTIEKIRKVLVDVGDLQRWSRRMIQQDIPVVESRAVVVAVRAALDVTSVCAHVSGVESVARKAADWLDALSVVDHGNPCLFPGDAGVVGAYEDLEAARRELRRIEQSVHPDARLEAFGNGHRIRLSVKRLQSVPEARARFAVSINASGASLTSSELDTASSREKESVKMLEAAQKDVWSMALSGTNRADVMDVVEWMCDNDFVHACAHNVVRFGHVMPEMLSDSGDAIFRATKLGNPIAEKAMEQYSKELYVRNDVVLDDDNRHILLYSVNGCGKSCLLRSVGIAIVMAQAGMFVAADKLCVRPFKRVDTRILTPDNVHRGLSSFTAELSEISEAINSAGPRSLLLADEMFASTEWRSGTALVGTTIARLANKGSKTFVTTHFHELALNSALDAVRGLSVMHLAMHIEAGVGLVYDRTLKQGPCSPSYGLAVAAAFGFDAAFVRDAASARADLTGEGSKRSRYNSRVVLSKCEACGARATETHHIMHRCEAVRGKHGPNSENHVSNLIPLCDSCHHRAHEHGLRRVRTLSGFKVVFGSDVSDRV